MFNLQPVLKTFAGITTFGVISLTSGATYALTLTGGFGFSGTANLNPEAGITNPTSVTANFNLRFFNQASGSFEQILPSATTDPGNTFNFLPNPLTFTQNLAISQFVYNSQQLVVEFGTQTIDGVTDTLTITIAPNLFVRNSNDASSSMVNVGQIAAVATFGGMNTAMNGSYSVNDTQSLDGTFSMSFTAIPVSVPEPNTHYTLLALGLFGAGLILKRSLTH